VQATAEAKVNTSKLSKWDVEPYLLAHEFLYLLCNCEDRLHTIRKTHKFELTSQKGNINHWELRDNETGGHRVSHIDLLNKTAF
jgi:hypothetical protein